eukprot:9378147-Alexandrium_andersonii.AAC.1
MKTSNRPHLLKKMRKIRVQRFRTLRVVKHLALLVLLGEMLKWLAQLQWFQRLAVLPGCSQQHMRNWLGDPIFSPMPGPGLRPPSSTVPMPLPRSALGVAARGVALGAMMQAAPPVLL